MGVRGMAAAALVWVTSAVCAAQALFPSADLIDVRLEAPFDQLFGDRSGDVSVRGVLTYTRGDASTAADVEVSTRGHTSLRETECQFPKLRIEFAGARRPRPAGTGEQERQASPFDDLESVKIGTHCGESPDERLTPRFGRLANEKSPHREAFVYRLLEVMGVPAPSARPARIEYVFASAARPPLRRNAMFLEDDEQLKRRYAAEHEIPESRFRSAREVFNPSDTVRVAFAQAMIGNFDWCLRMSESDTYRCNARHPLWNIKALVREDGRTIPVIHDFDLAGMVVGRHTWFDTVFNDEFAPSRVEIEVLSQVQRTRTLFPRAELDRARHAFVGRKNGAYAALDTSRLDEEGRAIAKAYLDAFFAAIEDDGAFYRPVVVNPEARIYVDAGAKQTACGDGRIPVGTPVKQAAPGTATGAATDDLVQVIVLDALWHWTRRCDAVRTGSVWLARGAIDTNYPM
jgi:hypothetical protein